MMKKSVDDFKKLTDAFVQRTKKPCIVMDLVDVVPGVLDNKFGGAPFLPEGETVPVTTDGVPMNLVMQLDLEQVELDGWPKAGILEVFFDNLANYPTQFAFRLFDKSRTPQTTSEIPGEMFERAWGMKLSKGEAIMSMSDFRFDRTVAELIREVFGEEVPKNRRGKVNWMQLSDYMEEAFDLGVHTVHGVEKPVHWSDLWPHDDSRLTLGGYADFTQTDPRGYDVPEEATESIFTIDSYYDLRKINLGDAGIMVGLIKPEDLKAGNFGNAFLSWDCC